MTDEAPAPKITVGDARSLLDAGEAILVDVREPHEWDAGHAPEAQHIPIGSLDASALPADKQIICTCRGGGRGGRAAKALREQGLSAFNLEGGMTGWSRVGQPLVTSGGEEGTVADP